MSQDKAPNLPHVKFVFPNVNLKDVKYCLELPEVKAFGHLASLRSELEQALKNAKPKCPSVKWFKDKDRKLAKTQYTLTEVLLEGDKLKKLKGTDEAMDAAFLVAAGGARL